MIEEKQNIKPIVRWAGGKTWLTKSINKYLPPAFDNYFEPFVGGAAIYLHLKSEGIIKRKAYLSDINSNLINSYKQIKNNFQSLKESLQKHKNEKKYYYDLRDKVFEDPIEQASRFLYLNRTSYNGIYRENLKGEYNVPFGSKNYKTLFDFDNLEKVSNLMSSTFLSTLDYKERLTKPKQGDLVFIDPPYTVAHSNNGFVRYNQKIFKWEDQMALQRIITSLSQRGVFVILTNASHQSISDLYSSGMKRHKIERSSLVGGRGATRGKVEEFIFINFNI